jgi:hypothetical protein
MIIVSFPFYLLIFTVLHRAFVSYNYPTLHRANNHQTKAENHSKSHTKKAMQGLFVQKLNQAFLQSVELTPT